MESDLWQRVALYLDPGEYLIGDSAYPVSIVTVTPFVGSKLSKDERDFNSCVAHVRACNENCIGMLKERWTISKDLPLALRSSTIVEDTNKALDWILACAILHNFLLEEEGLDWFTANENRTASEAIDQAPYMLDRANDEGENFRNKILRSALVVGRSPSGIVTHKHQAAQLQKRKDAETRRQHELNHHY